jgi:hypothetical protein
MASRHVIVDGSNIATEGNSFPTLRQLDEAVREFMSENPDDIVTVVVDATFGHRIPEDERERFEQAELAGEIVSPPAGAIGRGDAFLLRVADKVGGTVLSNDSFQEFHGEYEWLFDKGRLIGGKPVPGVGWVFTPRSPVRGPKSRESVKEAKRKRKAEQATDEAPESGLEMVGERSHSRGGERKLKRAIAAAVEEAVEPEKAGRKRRRRRGGEPPAEPLNAPFNFIEFIPAHQLGSEVEGTVEEFSSHGAFVRVGEARCYLPLSAMGDPPPRSAREALRKGELRTFVVQAFDPLRRGIELALAGFAHVAGVPTPETIEAEIHEAELPGQLNGAVGKAPGEATTGEPLQARRASTRAASKAGRPAARSQKRAAAAQPAAAAIAEPAAAVAVVTRPARSAKGTPAAKPAPAARPTAAAKPPTAKPPTAKPAAAKLSSGPAKPARAKKAVGSGGATATKETKKPATKQSATKQADKAATRAPGKKKAAG